jgi:hypothetical protein
MYTKCACKLTRACQGCSLVMLVEPVEQRFEIKVDHKRYDIDLDI